MTLESAEPGKEAAIAIGGAYDSTGAAGGDLEASVVADAMSVIIAGVGHRALPKDVVVDRLHQQRRTGPRGFDDLVLSGEDGSGLRHSAFVQVRRQFTIGDNEGFAPLARAILAHDQAHPDAPWSASIVSDRLSPSITDADSLVQAARAALNAEDFFERWRAPRTLNAGKRNILKAVRNTLGVEDGEEVWRVLRRLSLVEVDFGLEASRDDQAMADRLAACLEAGGPGAADLCHGLRSLSLNKARLSASFDRAALIAEFGARFAFAGSVSHRKALVRILAESDRARASIETTLGQISLLRPAVHDAARQDLAGARALRLTGEAGCGKSGTLARLVAGFSGPVVLIKEDRVEARHWNDHARRLGADIDATTLIAEFGGSGRALLAIDGADRLLLSERRGVVVDLLSAIAGQPAGHAWKILTTGRTVRGQDIVRNALDHAGLATGIELGIEPLDAEDVAFVAEHIPQLAPLLDRDDLSGRNHELFTLREHLSDPEAPGVGAEIASATRWATRGQRSLPRRPERDTAIAQIAGFLVDRPGREVGRAEVDPVGLQALIDEDHVRVQAHRDAVTFSHDVYEDWALARAFVKDWRDLPERLRKADQPLWWLRAVRLAAQIILETAGVEAWRGMVAQLTEATDLDPAWGRTALTAALYSEKSASLLTAMEPMLLADGSALLERLLETLLVLEARPNDRILNLPGKTDLERLRIAAALPQPSRSWRPFLLWSTLRWASWPPKVYPRLAQIAEIWLRATEGFPHGIGRAIVKVCHDWLVTIEDANHPPDGEESRDPFGDPDLGYGGRRDLEKELRLCLTLGVASNPALVESYLDRLAGRRRRHVDVEQLLKAPRQLPSALPRAYVDLVIAHVAPPFPRVRDHLFRMSRWSGLDFSGLNDPISGTAAPSAYGFDQLFDADPDQALRLLRKFEKRAVVNFRHYMRQREGRRARKLIVRFPWGDVPVWGDDFTYRWARGAVGPTPLGALYMALDLWLAKQAAQGVQLDVLFRRVLRPHGLNATLSPCIALAVEHINTPGQIDHIGPILAEPRVWSFEVARYSDDQTWATQPFVFIFDHAREEVLEVGKRYANRQHIRMDLALPFMLMADEPAASAYRARVETWSGQDLANYEDELDQPEVMAGHEAQIARYRVDTRRENIKLTDHPSGFQVTIEPDPATAAEMAQDEVHRAKISAAMGLVNWVRSSLDAGRIDDRMTLVEALERCKAILANGPPQGEDLYLQQQLGLNGMVGAAAVVALQGDDELVRRERNWLRSLLVDIARCAPPAGVGGHSALAASEAVGLAAKGLGALVNRDPNDKIAIAALFELATSSSYAANAQAVGAISFAAAPRAAWSVLWAAIHQCVHWRGAPPWDKEDERRKAWMTRRAQHGLTRGLRDLGRTVPRSLPLPPNPVRRILRLTKNWRRPVEHVMGLSMVGLDPFRLEKILEVLPVTQITARAEVARALADYLGKLADAIRGQCEGPLKEWRQNDYPFKLARVLSTLVGRLNYAWPGAASSPPIWEPLTRFTEREHAVDHMGQVLQAMTDDLVKSGKAPDAVFWSLWDPAARWVMEHGRPAWRDRWDAVGAAGFVGPYGSPLPPDWPHLEHVLPRIDAWVRKVGDGERQAYCLFKFCDRFSLDQLETWALPWIEHIVQTCADDEEFWEAGDTVNHAATILGDLLVRRPALAQRLRPTLAILADRGSLAARQAQSRFVARPEA